MERLTGRRCEKVQISERKFICFMARTSWQHQKILLGFVDDEAGVDKVG